MSTSTGETGIGCKAGTEHSACGSKKMVWTGRSLSTLVVLFMVMDGVMKLVKPAPVMQATARLGFPDSAITGIGIVLLACTIFVFWLLDVFTGQYRDTARTLRGK